MSSLPSLLLTTKLYRPPADANWVARPQLLARLDAGLAHKLILLSAPAGFGKSTLVSQWLAQLASNEKSNEKSNSPNQQSKPIATCWLSLDEGDNQLVQFLRYLIAAVRTCEPAACPTTESLLAAAQLPGVDYLVDVVVSELDALTVELVFVLDDYHLIRSQEVHQVMRHLLRYLPARLHLVLLSRTDPPLRLGRLRIEQQITELRAADLRFEVAQTRQFLDRRLGQPLDDDALNLLHTRAEGWITALQLSSIALQNQDPHHFLDDFRGNNRLLVGYLVEEVMQRLSEPLRDFLLRTAIVDQFCAPLADALLADRLPAGSSQALIAELEAQNLFIILLDQDGDWVRYHHLFRDFLCFQLKRTQSPVNLARLHRIASAWYAEQGSIEEALRHALAAGDEAVAVDLIITQLHPMLERQLPMITLTHWLALFPPPSVQAQPRLLFVQIWLSAFGIGPATPHAQLSDIENIFQSDPALSADQRQALLADLHLLRGITTYWSGEPQQALTLLQGALDRQPRTHQFARAQALFHLAAAHTGIGEPAVGRTLLRTALATEKTQRRPTLMILFGGLAILHLHAGELADVIDIAQQAVAAVDAIDAPTTWQGIGYVDIWYGWAHYFLGIVHYEQNNLAIAAHHWRRIENMRYRTNPGVYQGSLLGLALIAQVDGAATKGVTSSQAVAYAQAAREFVAEIRRPNLLAVSTSFDVRLALANGETKEVGRRTREIQSRASQGTLFGVELPFITRLRALLAEGSPDALTEALTFADACLHNAKAVHNVSQTIQILVLQALILYELRRTENAYDLLASALTLAEPGSFLRTFLDLGAPMAALLREYVIVRGTSAHINNLLAAFARERDVDQPCDLTAEYVKRYGITPLTPRELEVLELVSQRFAQAEIAETLSITIGTVKNHTHSIYSKLAVRSGRQAVAKAREVGILPPA